jgi:hypothetical protein
MPAAPLTPHDVNEATGVDVTQNDIDVADALIETATGYTVDAHVDTRSIASVRVNAARSIVAARVHAKMIAAGSEAVTSETATDYTYTESLATHFRFAGVVDGTPQELLGINQAAWGHI